DSLSIGEPVMYRGFEVGRVESSRFNIAKRQVHYQIFVKSPYSELLTENTYFWNSSGVDFSATAEGVKINVGSLESIISGGITFDVPTDLPLGGSIDIDENHILYPDKNSVYEQRQYHSHEFIVLFKDSVRGLNAGAPVAYRGIRLGTVVQVVSTLALVNEFDAGERRIPVKIKIEPARFGMPDTEQSAQAIEKYVDRWVEQGLKASLKSGSLLTGKLFVDLNYYDVAKRITASGKFHGVQIIPSVEGSLAQIEQKVFAILDKFEKMPINVTIDSINKMLSSADASINQLNGAVAQVKELLSSQQTQDIPDNINKTLSELSKTLASYNQQGPMYSELQRSMVQFQQLMREIEPLIKGLNNKPNALIFKSQAASDPEPKGTSK
ncbi:MAG: MCE family protein, partial [Psychrobium sp.]|nr:MCE family protein [Psychrobium sp.]